MSEQEEVPDGWEKHQVDVGIMDEKGRACDNVEEVCRKLHKQMPKHLMEEFFRKKHALPATHHDPRLYSTVEFVTILSANKTLNYNGVPYRVSQEKPSFVSEEFVNAKLGEENSSHLFEAGQSTEIVDGDFNARIIESAHRELSRLNYPVFFLDEQTHHMLQRSKMSESIPLEELVFPLPSMIVSLPKGCHKTREGEVCAISITKTFEYKINRTDEWRFLPDLSDHIGENPKPWSEVKTQIAQKMNPMEGEVFPVLTVVAVLDKGEAVVGKYPIGKESVLDVINKHKDIFHADYMLKKKYAEIGETQGEIAMMEAKLSDMEEMSGVVELATKILCFMTAKKEEWATTESIAQPAKWKKGKLKREELWSPNFIGRSYGNNLQAKGYGESGGEKDGRKLRYHWRSGCIRGQWYGPLRSKYKTVIIDPYPVNPPE
tara:strand:+ start:508 stop:1803 length:1296 start_codon:yes stop_codon:yes gene_type:complete